MRTSTLPSRIGILRMSCCEGRSNKLPGAQHTGGQIPSGARASTEASRGASSFGRLLVNHDTSALEHHSREGAVRFGRRGLL